MDETEKKKKSKFGWGLLVGILVGIFASVAICVILLFGTKRIVASLMPTPNAASSEQGKTEASAIDAKVVQKLKLIEEVFDKYYYEENIDKTDMPDNLYKALVASLGDKYSAYYSADEYKEAMEDREGVYFGIGAYVSLNQEIGYACISSVMKDSPAEEAGVHANDIIYMVEGKDTYGMELDDVVKLIKGPEGTKVHITFVREGEEDYVELDVERRAIESTTVYSEMLDSQIGYIQLTAFESISLEQFTAAKEELENEGMKGLVLDLRSNPGGNLTTVVDIARLFCPEGLIVYTEDRFGNRDEYKCDGKNEFFLPMVVLVNGYSASASEVLTGALKDYEKCTVVGTTTYGKGIVQNTLTLTDGSAIKLTTEAYYTPKGHNLHGVGIKPDVECEFDTQRYYDSEGEEDNQIEKAVEILMEKIK